MDRDIEHIIRGFFAIYRMIKKVNKKRRARLAPKIEKLEDGRYDVNGHITLTPPPTDYNGRNYWIPVPPLSKWVSREASRRGQ